jgi:hypothetical protein
MASENEKGIFSFPAGETIEPYRRIKLSSGTALHAAAGDRHIGISVNSEAVSIGAQVAVKLNNFPGTRKVECAGAVTLGATVYGAATGMVDDAFAANGASVGTALDTGDGAGSIIEILPLAREGGSDLLAAAVGDSAALGTGSGAELTFSNGSYTFPAGSLLAGDLIRVKAKARLDATNGADTFTMRLKIGTETIATTPAPDAVNGDIAIIEADIAINIGGAGGQVEALGNVMNDALVAGLATPFHKAAAAEDLSAAVVLAVTGQFNAADAGNTAKMDHFTVERIRK